MTDAQKKRPALSALAAIEFWSTRRVGACSRQLLQAIENGSRVSRLIRDSGMPEAWGAPPEATAPRDPVRVSKLVPAFLTSQAKWLASRQQTVDDAVLARRLAACSSCPKRQPAPDHLLYRFGRRVVGADSDDICSECGCFVLSKAKRHVENCPVELRDGISRWEEPMTVNAFAR